MDLSLEQLLSIAIESRLADVHVALPGIVATYNPLTQRADVKPAVKVPIEGAKTGKTVYEALPIIPSVPVAWPAALLPGDSVLLVFSELDAQAWEATGTLSNPKNQERHGLGSPFAVPFHRTAGPLEIGIPGLCEFVALQSQLLALKTAIDAAAAAETLGSGLGGMNALKTALDNPSVLWPEGIATGPAGYLKASPALVP